VLSVVLLPLRPEMPIVGVSCRCDVSLEKNEGGGGEKEECLLLITKMRLDLTRTCIHSDYPAGCLPSKKTLFVSFPLCT